MLVAASILLRAAALFALPAGTFDRPFLAGEYFSTLRDHGLEYIATNTYRPPLTYALHLALVAVSGPAPTQAGPAILVATALADIVAACVLFAVLRLAKVTRWIALTAVLVLSLGVVPFEVWRNGSHYDHHTVPLATAFAAAIVAAVVRPGRASALAMTVAGSALVLQSPSALYVVPLTALAVLALTRTAPSRAALAAALLVPAAFGALLVVKNVSVAQVAATGNQAGSSLMIFVHEALRDRPQAVQHLVASSGVPEWFVWCYAERRPPGGATEPSWYALAGAYGICYPSTTEQDPSWPFDLTPLEDHLRATGEAQLAALVARDDADMRSRRYLFHGYSPEQTARWVGVYGSAAPRVALTLLAREPLTVVRTAVRVLAQHLGRGPLLPLRTLSAPANDGMRTSPPLSITPILAAGATAFALVLYGALAAFGTVAVLALRRRRWPPPTLLALGAPIVLLTLIFTAAAWDVDRYFMQTMPYILTAGAISGDRLRRRQV